MTFSFVIPTYNHFNLLHQVLYDIYQKCHPVLEVIVMDDGSTDQDYKDGLKWWNGNGLLPLRVIQMQENSGFLKTSNAGLKRAKGDIICLLSNDVRIYKDIVTPLTGLCFGKVLAGGRLIDWNSGWNTFGGRIFPYIEGWLLTMSREGWEEVGYFDTQFAPFDFEDIDVSTKAMSLGYGLIPLPDSGGYVHHIGGQSIGFNPEREEQTKINQRKFEKKWVTKGKV